MSIIKAPFNFVPVEDNVFFPEWADQISQDVPFADGVSGTIDVEMTAETPIFVRNGHSKEDKDAKNDNYKSFSKESNGKYFIPATSIKGEIRNVLSILSLSKMKVEKNSRFAQRDWNNENLYDKTTFAKAHCGWLKENPKAEKGKEWYIVDCGIPYRIGMDMLQLYFLGKQLNSNNDFLFNRFWKGSTSKFDLNKEQEIDEVKYDPKTAAYKYALAKKYSGNKTLYDLNFTIINPDKENQNAKYKVKVDSYGEVEGDIVMTGQPDLFKYPRPTELEKGAGKFYEFVFPKSTNDSKKHYLSQEEHEQYLFIYKESADWKLWKDNEKGIPVFFRLDEKNNNKFIDFGLSALYKIPYKRTVQQSLPSDNLKSDLDLSECIFGYTKDKEGLRGRIQFSPAFSENGKESEEIILLLNSPKASYYPIYVKQENLDNNDRVPLMPKTGKNGADKSYAGYQTYNRGKIAGWKMYMLRTDIWNKDDIDDEKYKNLVSYLRPLKAGASFKYQIRFHNLKGVELGALLSALTFHNTPNTYHSYGQGKPYGFGRTKITNWSLHISSGVEVKPEVYMALFEEQMTAFFNKWNESESLTSLITAAKSIIPKSQQDSFTYMYHDNDRSDFTTAKDKANRETLKPIKKLLCVVRPQSVLDNYKEEVKKYHEIIDERNSTDTISVKTGNGKKGGTGPTPNREDLSDLNSKNENGEYIVKSTGRVATLISKFIKGKENELLNNDHLKDIITCLIRFRVGCKSDFKKDKCWKELKKILTEDQYNYIFSQVNPS